jgi:ABC-type cobalamin transport system permease subunit
MIDPETGLLGFRIGIFVVLIGIWLLFIAESGSAAFYADVVAIVVAVIFLVILAVLIRRRR